MSLRWKLALAMAVTVLVATVVFGAASLRSARDRLYAEVDRSLLGLDALVASRQLGPDRVPERGPLAAFEVQVVRPDGTIGQTTFAEPIPVAATDIEVVGRPRADAFSTVTTSAGDYRVRTIGFPRGAVQIGRSLDETDRVLTGLRNRTIVLAALVVAAAAAAGVVIADRATVKLRRLMAVADRVGTAGRVGEDVTVDVEPLGGDDEVGRLGAAFGRMLEALRRSHDQQQRLVQDAGHELRTPLTSLRTNLDVLRRHPDLDTDTRDAILADLHAETGELAALVDELVVAASGRTVDEPRTRFDLGELVTDVGDRFARRTGREVRIAAGAGPVEAQRSGVQRAVSCLLDNAQKFDPSGAPIDVTVQAGAVTVADRGIGIAADEVEHVFERFHRAEAARALPGSGLGLSMVREVARRHGGDVFARPRAGGGSEVGFSLGFSPGSHPAFDPLSSGKRTIVP